MQNFVAAFIKFFIFISAFLFLSNAANAKTHKPILTYDVYAGGVHAVNAFLNLNQSSQNYTVSLKAETIGFLKRLADWRGEFRSSGIRVSSDHHRPRMHVSEAIWRGEVESNQYAYTPQGALKTFKKIEAGVDKTPEKIDPALTKNATDILSAMLDTMDDLNKKGDCSKRRTIFDGDRNFEVIFKNLGTEELKKTKYNIYEGKAILCSIEVKPKLGKWHQKPRGWLSIQEQGRKQGTMPVIWFAKLSQNPEAPYMPVKVRVKTDYGTLFMHLTSYKDETQKTLTASFKKEEKK